ncbi:glycine cleavage system aminomethyltransferase GcvT [Corynebacterium parakroppenstedtii]|uniref:glycine cleavage system aminomethyltransferase GcvT n=1 Tax=Corynebacterium parakroppenstedtii TaxID=2828363 RepID=UPI001C8E720F|nr:glycine cleavage system aminomethyltransferase GcvT [Corynebacterium parakroppenstedtii]
MTDQPNTGSSGAGSARPQKTALHDVHEKLGARFTDFGGWDMPLKYGSELDEHKAVRTDAGIFDLSHMGEVRVSGPQAAEALDHALISRLSAVAVGKAKYSMMCTEDGTIIDDLITYRLADDEFLVIPNAGNAPTVASELVSRAESFDCTVADESSETSLIAVQGPNAERVLASLPGADVRNLAEVKYYAFFRGTVAGHDVIIARTGYTGEDGFEIFVPNSGAHDVWAAVMDTDAVTPCGLASRDTLRLEAGMPLCGHELDLSRTPVDAGLGVLAATKSKDAFVGRDAIVAAKKNGAARKLVGLKGDGRRAARAGYTVLTSDDKEVGEVTSGALSPTLGYPVAMAYVDADVAEPGTALSVDIRGKHYPYTVVQLPFYKRDR